MDGPPRIERVARPWQVEGSTPKPPLEVRISRAFLSFAILLLLGSIFFFLYHFLSPPDGFRSGAAFLTKEISIGFFYLSVLFSRYGRFAYFGSRCGEGRKIDQKSGAAAMSR